MAFRGERGQGVRGNVVVFAISIAFAFLIDNANQKIAFYGLIISELNAWIGLLGVTLFVWLMTWVKGAWMEPQKGGWRWKFVPARNSDAPPRTAQLITYLVSRFLPFVTLLVVAWGMWNSMAERPPLLWP